MIEGVAAAGGFSVEGHQRVLACAGQVRGVEAGEDHAFEERDGEVCLSA